MVTANDKPVMVVGAPGLLGTEICRQLTRARKKVQALIPCYAEPEKLKLLRRLGVQTVIGDVSDRVSLDIAFAGAGAVIFTGSSTALPAETLFADTPYKLGQLNVVDAAKDAGVEHFINVSFLESPEHFPLQDVRREVEARIMETEMVYTILRPSFFMEVWLSPALGFDAVNNRATIYGEGANKIAWISVKDVAAFAVAALENGAARYQVIDLGGPEALAPLDVIKYFEDIKGAPFELNFISEEALRYQLENAGDDLQRSYAALMLAYAAGVFVPMHDTLKRFPIKLESIRDFSHAFLEPEILPA